jgi:hypothetical protein
MTECIHGLDFASCDVCNPPKRVEPVETTRRAAPDRSRQTRHTPLKARTEHRLHAVISVDDFAEALETGALEDPTYFHGPEELAWAERRRAKDAAKNVVLVTTFGAVAGLDALPLDAVQLVAVANTVMQERVRSLLASSAHSPRVAVFPPWFVAS